MIFPWGKLNTKGRLLYSLCILNLIIAFFLASGKDMNFIFSLSVSMFCGLFTFSPRYHKNDS